VFRDVTERRKVADAQSHLSSIVEQSKDAIISQTLDGMITSWNIGAQLMYGYAPDEIMGKQVSILAPPACQDELTKILDLLNHGHPIIFLETWRMRKDGTIFPASLTASPIRGYDGSLIGSSTIVRDITEPVKIREGLRIASHEWQTTFDSMSDMIILIDNTHKILRVNRAFAEAFSSSPEKMIGRKCYEVVHHTTEPHPLCPFITTRMQGQTCSCEMFEKSLGKSLECTTSPFPDADGNLVGAVHVFRDVSHRRKAEEALRQSEQRLRRMYESGMLGVIYWNTDGNILDANNKFLEMTGYTREELHSGGINWIGMTPPEYRYLDEQSLKELASAGVNKAPFEKEYLRKNGTRLPVLVVGAMLDDCHVNGVAFVLDISERKKAEEAVLREKNRARQLLDIAGVMILGLDTEGKVTLMNARGREILGCREEEILGKHWVTTFLPERIRPKLQGDFQTLSSDNIAMVENIENPVLTKSGEERLIAWHNSTIRDEKGQIVGTLSSGEDISERKKAEENMRQQTMMLANINDAVIGTDNNYRIIYWNEAAEKMYGYKVAEIIGQFAGVLEPLFIGMTNQDVLKQLDITGKLKVELTHLTRDGRRIIIDSSNQVVYNEVGKAISLISINRDITQRKKVEKALMKSEARLGAAVEIAGLGIYEEEVNPSLNTGKRVMVLDGRMRALLSIPEEEEQRAREYWTEHIHPEDLRNISIPLVNQFENEGPDVASAEYRYVTDKGEIKWFSHVAHALQRNAEDKIFRVTGVVQDITERKYNEETHKFLVNCDIPFAKEDFFHALARYLSETLRMEYVCIDRLEEDGLRAQTLVVYSNGKFEGNQQYALKDTPCGEVVRDKICGYTAQVRNLFPRDAALQEMKAESYFGTTLCDSRGQPIGLIAVIGHRPVKDAKLPEMLLGLVAQRAASELEIRRIEQDQQHVKIKAETSSRLAALGEMAAGIAHEINNPLTGVIGFAQLLKERRELPEDVQESVKIIDDGSQRVKEIVKRMLTFARQTKPLKTRADLHELIETTLELRNYVLKTNNIEVIRDYARDLPWISVDPGQIQQVFINIIINAEYAMNKLQGRGTLTIKTEKLDQRVRISFIDNGPGISRENLTKLFDPFFTTKDVGEGTGLGLSLAHGIIVEHGGTIRAESEFGKGATFIIELPIDQEEQAAEAPNTILSSSNPQKRRANILVIEDEKAILTLVKVILSQDGHVVKVFDDPHKALEELYSTTFDVILLDMRMPVMSGMEIYEKILKSWPELVSRVIFITGDTSPTIMEYITSHKINFITKPFSREILREKVFAALWQ
jgi:PAS domain S-box-containing protein